MDKDTAQCDQSRAHHDEQENNQDGEQDPEYFAAPRDIETIPVDLLRIGHFGIFYLYVVILELIVVWNLLNAATAAAVHAAFVEKSRVHVVIGIEVEHLFLGPLVLEVDER